MSTRLSEKDFNWRFYHCFYNFYLRCLNNQPKDYFEDDQVSGEVRNNALGRLTKVNLHVG